jgi:2,4-dienoyl-CoA reductase-like NADH-dependent reductase (Old Yellow Enzyme family)
MTLLGEPMPLARGPAWKNRVALAPLTNMQSHADATLSDEELRWLAMRGAGGFGHVMTCAAHVSRGGQGFPGQLGIWADAQLPGLRRLADALRATGAVSSVQLYHGGRRADAKLTGEDVVAPWDDAETGARALTEAEVATIADDFAEGARRAEDAGFDGVELHAAHGYLLGQFLDSENNQDPRWGGDFDKRSRFLLDLVARIRSERRGDFQIGVRISPERFGIRLADSVELARRLMAGGAIDWLDLSLWDVTKAAEEAPDTRLFDHFAGLPRNATKVGVAGKIMSAKRAAECLDAGADFVFIGRGAILHHDFAARALADPGFVARATPVPRADLEAEGLSPAFIDYMETWKTFVAA